MRSRKFICDPNSPYHVTARCINKEWFCNIDIAWKFFCEQLWFISYAYKVQIHAFVLMPNHFHLLVSAPNGNLSEAMRWLMSQTSRSITKNSDRINETYGDRFHRSRIGSYHYYMQCYKYIYHNPVKGRLCKRIEEYKYSSFHFLIGNQKAEFPIYDSIFFENSNFDSTLRWLNQTPKDEDWLSIRKAMQKSDFKIARHNSRKSHLEKKLL